MHTQKNLIVISGGLFVRFHMLSLQTTHNTRYITQMYIHMNQIHYNAMPIHKRLITL